MGEDQRMDVRAISGLTETYFGGIGAFGKAGFVRLAEGINQLRNAQTVSTRMFEPLSSRSDKEC